MCGIMAFSRLTPATRKMAPILAWELASRGQDSWGMTNGEEVIRRAGPQILNYEEPPEEWDGGPVVWHNRGASFRENAADPECAHPYTFSKEDGSSVIGVHNGVIRNHTELNTKYKRDFKVDSMHIWAHYAEGRSWKELEGWGNLVWFETYLGERTMNFARINDQALHAFTLEDGEMVLCSVALPVRWAAAMYGNPIRHSWDIKEYRQYVTTYEANGKDIPYEVKGPGVQFAYMGGNFRASSWQPTGPNLASGPVTRPTIPTGPKPGGNGEQFLCRICFKNKLQSYANGILCQGCFTDQVERWLDKQDGKMDLQNERRLIEKVLKIAAAPEPPKVNTMSVAEQKVLAEFYEEGALSPWVS